MPEIDLSTIDLLALIEADTTLKRVSGTNGGEWAGPCPFCGGRDRFRVQPHARNRGRWFCRGCGDERWHDAIDYVRSRDGLSFPEALVRLGLDPGDDVPLPPSVPRPRPPRVLAPPSPTWQARGRAFCDGCRAALWTPRGALALEWLRGRGLSDETIRAAALGYNDTDKWDTWAAWGLEPRAGKRGVWLPRGVVIPWFIGPDLWRVNIRRPVGDPKYIGPAGFGNGLYNAAALTAAQPAILVEGELDALTIKQHAGDLVTPVATGSTGGARRTRWIARLALCSLVLVAFDAEEDKGDKAARYWSNVLSNARRWRPYWDDANAMAQAGADVRAWIAVGVAPDSERRPVVPQVALSLPPTLQKEAEALLARCDGSAEWYAEWAAMEARLAAEETAGSSHSQ